MRMYENGGGAGIDLAIPMPSIGVLIAIERDPVAAYEPFAEASLPLAEELEIEVPDLLDRLHASVRGVLMRYQRPEPRGRWLVQRRGAPVHSFLRVARKSPVRRVVMELV